MKKNKLHLLLSQLCLVLLLCSCVPKNIIYFQDRDAGSFVAGRNSKEMKLQPNDRISVYVKSRNQELANVFNISAGASGGGMMQSSTNGGGSGNMLDYTIDADGNIDFPILGKVNVVGMNRLEVASVIQEKLKSQGLVEDAVVNVMYDNLYVNVLGEMGASRKLITQDKYTILDLISESGDLNFSSAKRKNIMIMREENGEKKAYKIDITSIKDVYDSPVYYLHQNDLVYVEPTNKRVRETTIYGNQFFQYGFWLGLPSIVLSIIALTR